MTALSNAGISETKKHLVICYWVPALESYLIVQIWSDYAKPSSEKSGVWECPFMTAQRLLTMLYYVKEIDDAAIPNNSILREFVGGSIFKDAL